MIRRRRVPVPLLALCLAVGLSSGCSVVRDAATWKMTPSAGPAAAGASAGTSAEIGRAHV